MADRASPSTENRAPGAVSMIDPRSVMRIKSLQMRAKVIVEGFYTGIHRSPYHGFSVEFSEYREYSPGDDPRYLDWKLYARSDRYYVKRFEDETNLRCYILLDASRSMGYRSGANSKYEYARTVAATLAYFLSLQRDAVGLLTFDEGIREYLPPRHRPGHLRRLMGILSREPSGVATDLDRPLEQIAETVRKRGLVILISDFLAPVDTLRTRLGYLRSRGHDIIVMRVLDPAETTFAFDNPGMFHDVETGRVIYIDPAAAREEYLRRFSAHGEQLKLACNDLGIDFDQMTIERPMELVLFDLVSARMRRGRRTLRRGGLRREAAR